MLSVKALTQVIMLITMGSLLLSCNADSLMGQITVDNIVNPDKVKPIITFENGPASLTGDQEISVSFTVKDDPEGKGIAEATLYYASNADNPVWKTVKEIDSGSQTLTFCVPNKSYDKPAFKIEATDLNGNKAEETFIATTESASPIALAPSSVLDGLLPSSITSDSNGLTNNASTDISISEACRKTTCSASSIKLEDPTWDIFYAINVDTASAPAEGDAAWTACDDAVTNGLTLADLTAVSGVDGDKEIRLWVKATDTDQDSTPYVERSALNTAVTVTYDTTAPAVELVWDAGADTDQINLAPVLQGGSTQNLRVTATDVHAITNVTIQYSPDGVIGNYVDIDNQNYTDLSPFSSPYNFTWSIPATDTTGSTIRVLVTDAAGNVGTYNLTDNAQPDSFNIDNTDPAVTLTDMPPVIRGGINNNITYTITDSNTISSVVLRYAADGTNFVDITTTPGASPYSWATPSDDTTASKIQIVVTDAGGNVTTLENAAFRVDSTPPTLAITDLAAKIQGGSDYGITFTNTDTNGVASLLLEYSIDNGTSWATISTTPTSIHTWTLPAATDSPQSIVRLTGTDSVGNSTSVNSNTFEIDSTPPDHSTLNVLGSTFIKKARGEYVLTDCSDVAEVLITDDLESPPFLATDPRWQTCSDTTYSMTYDNIKVGINNVRVWLKDSVENVNNSNWLSISTEYDPANITVVDGPSITTSQASLTIDICEEVGMTDVLFNFTGTRPDAGDAAWQTCSKAVGAFTSPVLSPGNNTLKAFFKYDDNFVSVFPIDVPVTYSPNLTWDQTPSTNKAALTFTGYTCTGISEVYFTQTAAPAPDGTEGTGPGAWQPCSTTPGSYTYELDGTTVGDQAVYAFFKNDADSSVYTDYDTITVNYDPPTLSIFGGSNISTNLPDLSIDDCSGIDKVFIKLNEVTPIPPSVADFDNIALNNFGCTTALNGLVLSSFPDSASLTLPSEGEHHYDVWLRYSADNFIAPHTMTRHRVVVNYLAEDSTPPGITGFTGADTNPTLTFENEVSPNTTPKTVDANGTRAFYTLNTCNPKANVDLTATITATNGSNILTPSGDVTGEITTGDYIAIDDTVEIKTFKVKSVTTGPNQIELVSNYTGATGSGYAADKTFPQDAFSHVILKTVTEGAGAPSAPAVDDVDWVACSTATSAIKTKSIIPPDENPTNYDVYAFFKDAAGNVQPAFLPEAQHEGADRTITIDLPDTPVVATDVPRPNVFLKDAPTVVTPPAQFRVEDCTGLDQVYLEPSKYPNYGSGPSPTLSGWQDCETAFSVDNITYDVDLRGSYTISVWFKEPGGVINPQPRDIAFIFEPTQGAFNNPLALWTLDNTTRQKNRFIDGKGDNHLYIWDPANVSSVTAKVDEGTNLSGTNSLLFTENAANLKPTISVTLSMWAYLTNADGGTKGLAGAVEAGTGGYGLRLDSGELRFYASGRYQNAGLTQSAAYPTTAYTTGWHHIIGTSDGRYIKLYLDGQQVGDTVDLGSAANLTYGCNQLFAVGGLTDCSVTPLATNLFDEKIDEVVIFPQYFTDQDALDHYIDTFNAFHANQDNVAPADITLANYYGEFLQNVLLTTPDCGDAKYVYVDETTHPPTVDSDRWQLCSTVAGATIQADKPAGSPELKVWAKDEYDNISASYIKVDTTVTGILYQEVPLLYYSFDNDRKSGSTIYDPYSGHHATNNGAATNNSGLQNASLVFNASESDYVERKYAFNAQPKDKVTMSVWAKLSNGDGLNKVIAGTRDGANNHGYSIELNSGELQFIVETAGGPRTVSVLTSSYSDGWHNIIGTYDGRYQKLYLNANEVASFDHTSTVDIQYTGLGNFVVGAGARRDNNGARVGTFFNDEIDEVFVWNAALSQATINWFFFGQDTVPPVAVSVSPESFTVGVPVAKFNVSSCNDIASVYVALDDTAPISEIDGWQTCSDSGFEIRSPLLENGLNNARVWFKDASGNVSTSSTLVANIDFQQDLTIPTPDSYWTLDDANIDGSNVFDVTAGRDGSSYGTLPIAGKVEEALQFNGVDEYVEAGYDVAWQPTNQVSLSAWFNSDSLPTTDQVIAGNYNGGGYALVLTNGFLEFRVEANGTTQVAQYDTTPLSPSTWYHVVGVWDDGTIRLFVDGTEVVNTVLFANMNIDYANNNSFLIGAAPTTTTGASGSYFDGGIDEVSFFATAITDTVVAEMYDRGQNGDKIFYDVEAPTIPVTATLLYYNSLVSRANLTFTDCDGIDYVIVTKDVFPPDKNDEDWQPCNTVVGGILTKELRTTDSFGKLWTKDNFGNVSKQFEYVPVTTKYDLPIQRPIVHWTFDPDHYAGTQAFDRISNINLQKVRWYDADPLCGAVNWTFDGTTNGFAFPGATAVLNTGLDLVQGINTASPGLASNPGDGTSEARWLRALHPQNAPAKPTEKLSVASWVYLNQNGAYNNEHIVSTELGSTGYAIRVDSTSGNSRGVRFSVWVDNGAGGTELIEPYLETREFSTGWHLVHGVYDGIKASLYFDGILVKSFTNSGGVQRNIVYSPNAKLHVGVKQTAGDNPDSPVPFTAGTGSYGSCTKSVNNIKFFDGRIDEILIWDVASSGLEASSLYHNGADILYSDDTTPPDNTSITLENTKPDMFSDKAFYTLTSCFRDSTPGPLKPAADQIVAVLVNEGTQPDKQDDRWQVCRERLGNFGLQNLTPGGHTITFWFKDRAGNVTPASTDGVVNYIDDAIPQANAFWPLNRESRAGSYQRNVIENGVHDLLMVNVDTPLIPGVSQTSANGQVDEAMHLYVNGPIGSFMSAKTTRLLRPVNYMTVGGWFWLDSTWNTGTRYLIDKHINTNVDNRAGYSLTTVGGQLRFTIELDIVGTQTLSTNLSGLTTGWNHVLGRFDGFNLDLIVNNSIVAESNGGNPFAERDYLRHDTGQITDFRVGADSNNTSNVSGYYAERVDEIGLWGFDLTDTGVNSLYTANNAGNPSTPALPNPDNVDNAFIYFYKNEGNRARMTMLDCTNIPYLYVKEESADPLNPDAPSAESYEWVKCNTEIGGVLSAELPVNTDFIEVWAKNADGVVSTVPGVREIDPITEDYSLEQPIQYFSLDQDQVNGTNFYDQYSETNAIIENLTYTTNDNKGGAAFNDNNSRLRPAYSLIHDLRSGLSINTWAEFTNGDTNSEMLFRRNYYDGSGYEFAVYLSGGNLNLTANITQPGSFSRGTSYVTTSYPTSKISSGRHMVTAQYDGQKIILWLDAMKVSELDVGYRNWQTSAYRPLAFNTISAWNIGNSTDSWGQEIDEFRIYNEILTEAQLDKLHQAYLDDFRNGDTTPPTTALTPNTDIGVMESTFGANWPSESNDPRYFINSCGTGTGDDIIYGVFVNLSPSGQPAKDDAGWQKCDTDGGYYTGPTLASGNNTVQFWFKDQYGNVTAASQDIVVNYTQETLPAPVAYWPLDQRADMIDLSYEPVGGVNAYLYNVTDVAGRSNGGKAFDGIRHYIEVEHNTSFKPTEEISVSAWVNIPGGDGKLSDYILDTSANSNDGYFWRWRCDLTTCSGTSYDGNQEFFEFGLAIGGGVVAILDYPQPLLGTGWTHITTTFDGRYMKLYIDSVLARTKDLGREYSVVYDGAVNTSLIMGANATATEKPSGNYFAGQLDEVAVYDKALLQHQVTDLFNNYVNASTPIYSRGVTASVPANANVTRWEPTSRPYGDRYRFTVSDCGTAEMILINHDSATPPSATSEDWQPCNTYAGGILSAALPNNQGSPTTLAVWGKTFDGVSVTAAAGTVNGTTYEQDFVGPVAPSKVHWSLDSTAINGTTDIFDLASKSDGTQQAGADNTGVFTNGSVSIENGFIFTGDDYITIKPTPATNPYYNMSISAWAELTRGDTFHRHIVGNHQNLGSSTGAGTGLRVKDGELQFYVTARNPSTGGLVFYKTGIDSNLYSTNLHHIVGTYDGRSLVLYLDGVEVTRYNIPFYGTENFEIYHDDYSHWTIGAKTDGKNGALANTFFIGDIDDIRIWDQVLAPLEVYRLYDYGSFFLPSTDGILDPPDDPGIYLTSGLTTTTSPWALFTMPTCTAPNGEEIDSLFVSTDGTVPDNNTLGWQYCSTDDGYIESPILGRGATTVNVYMRDEEGEISIAYPFDVTYIEPDMPKPDTYYTFDADNSSGNSITYDQASYVTARVDGTVYDGFRTGKVGNAHYWELSIESHFTRTSIREHIAPTKDFTVSFWHRNPVAPSSNATLYESPMVKIYKNEADYIVADLNTLGPISITTGDRLAPNSWTHIALKREGNSIKIYLNGRVSNSIVRWNGANPKRNQFLAMGGGSYDNYLDEVVTYNQALNDDQIAFLYFAGANNENLLVEKENLVPIAIPDHYYTFDDADTAGGILSDKVGTQNMNIIDAVTTGEPTEVRHGQSYNFSRFEEVVSWSGDAPDREGDNNPTGTKQFLETDGSTQVALGTKFMIGAWVKRKSTYEFGDDRGAIVDQWGTDVENQSFLLAFNRAARIFEGHIRIGNQTHSISAAFDSHDNTNWAHVLFVRDGAWLTLYVNGRLSNQAYINNASHHTLPVNTPAYPLRLRIGESSVWSYYKMGGTMTVDNLSGNLDFVTVYGTGTSFTSDLQVALTGTVDVAPGGTTVTGTGTVFNNEVNNNDYINIGGEYHQVANRVNNTEIELATPHVAGATGASALRIRRGRIKVNGLERKVVAIASDTELTVNTAFPANFAALNWEFNINKNDQNPNDEWGLDNYVDEVAIWTNETASYGQANAFYTYNLTNPIATEPLVAMDGFGGNNTNSARENLSLSDCGSYTHVWVGFAADGDPLDTDVGDATYDGWVSCTTTAGAIRTPALVADSTNNLKLWFKTGTVVSTYTTTIDVIQSTGDSTPPTIPSSITMNTAATTPLSFARFTLNECLTNELITGVLVQFDGTDPSANDSRWKACTTVSQAYLSPPLEPGANTISFYFKDEAGNVTAKSNFAVTHTPSTITPPVVHFTMGDGTFVNNYLKDTINRNHLQAFNPGNITYPSTGKAGESIEFSTDAYVEPVDHNLSLTNAFTLAGWINLSVPGDYAHIVGQWNDVQTDSQWAMRVDQTGRVCLDVQTVNSAGVWNSNSYKRSCSTGRVAFAEWVHIAVIRSGADIDFYINNKLAGEDTIDAGDLFATTLLYRIGSQARGATNPTNGLLDEVSVWNTALTTLTLETAYAAGVRGDSIAGDITAQAMPISDHYWNYDDANYADPLLTAVLGPLNLSDNGTTPVVSAGTGQVGESFFFGNDSELVASADSIALGTDFTLATWVRVNAFTASEKEMILSKWDEADTNLQEFRLYTNDAGNVLFDYNTTAVDTYPDVGYNTLTTSATLTAGTWYHLAVTRSGAHVKVFINGQVAGYANVGTDPLGDLATPLRIGSNTVAANYLNGDMDETLILKSALDPNQVEYLYDKGAANTAAPTALEVTVAEPSTTLIGDTVRFTVGDCDGHANYTITTSATPPAGTAVTTTCNSGVVGDAVYNALATGSNTLYFYFGDGAAAPTSGPNFIITRED